MQVTVDIPDEIAAQLQVRGLALEKCLQALVASAPASSTLRLNVLGPGSYMPEEAGQNIRELRKGVLLNGISVRDLVEEGRTIEQAAEKGLVLRRLYESAPQGLKPGADSIVFAARLKSCPDTSSLPERLSCTLPREAASAYLTSCSSTRRFFWRPSSVSSSATKWVAPYPCAVRLSSAAPWLTSQSRTLFARASDSR